MTANSARSIALATIVVLSMVVATPLLMGTAAAAGTTTVSVSPGSSSVDVGGTTTVDVVVDAASGGVGAHNFTLSTDSSVVTITDVSLNGDPADFATTTEFAADNSSVEVQAGLADTADTGAVAIATVTLEGQSNGTAALDLTVNKLGDEAGAPYTVSSVNDASITVGTGGPAPEGATVSLQPSGATVETGATTSYDVVVDPADGGVGAHNFTVSTDASVATITDVSLNGDPADFATSTEFAADNSSVEVQAGLADTADTGAVTIATVTLTGQAEGSSTVDLTVNKLGNESGAPYTIASVNDASITVSDTVEPPAASVSANDQTIDGTSFEVASYTLGANGTTIGVWTVNETTMTPQENIGAVSPNASSGGPITVAFNDSESIDTSQPLAVAIHAGNPAVTTNIQASTIVTATVADVTFSGASGTGEVTELTVDEAVLGDGGFVVIHNQTELAAGNVIGSIVGNSAFLEAGTSTDVSVTLDEPITETGDYVAMAHVDSNDNESYDFPATNGSEDGPYVMDGNAVVDTGTVTVEEPEPLPSLTVTSLSAPANVTAGDNVTVEATIANVGAGAATNETVEFRFDTNQDGNLTAGEALATEEVSLAAGANTTVSFTVSTAGLDAGTYTHGVFTANDSRTASIELDAPGPGPLPGIPGDDPPTDTLSGNGFEDVNGDGVADFDDVVDLLFALDALNDADLTDAQLAAVNFDDSDDTIDFDDVVDLLFRL